MTTGRTQSAAGLNGIPSSKLALLRRVENALRPVRGLAALVLGGSHARGTHHPLSDVDIGLYYSEAAPFSIADIREAATSLSTNRAPIVTDFYEWGPWVNGGAWIQTSAGKLDLLYRNVDQLERVILDAHRGLSDHHYDQQPTFGFRSVIYLGETHVCVPLYDPQGTIARLKREVATYPEALKRTTIADSLGCAEFTLVHARSFAAAGDVYNTVGCMTRIASYLVQTLFALNETYFLGDKGVMQTIDTFPLRPRDYAAKVTAILARPGAGPTELGDSVKILEALWWEAVDLAGNQYRPRFNSDGAISDEKR